MTVSKILITLFSITAAIMLFARFQLFSGSVPDDLGVISGRLKAPSINENSVSSQAELFFETEGEMLNCNCPFFPTGSV